VQSQVSLLPVAVPWSPSRSSLRPADLPGFVERRSTPLQYGMDSGERVEVRVGHAYVNTY